MRTRQPRPRPSSLYGVWAEGVRSNLVRAEKFEDTSTGYWLSYAPQRVHYVDIGPLVHDIDCHPEGARLREGDGTYRPPANSSMLVHNLKTPSAFAYVHAQLRGGARPFEMNACMHHVHGAPLVDASVLAQQEARRSGVLWARAARGDLDRLMTAHNIHLRTALNEAGLTCHKCRKKLMAERMLRAAARSCAAATPTPRKARRTAPSNECLLLVAASSNSTKRGRRAVRRPL